MHFRGSLPGGIWWLAVLPAAIGLATGLGVFATSLRLGWLGVGAAGAGVLCSVALLVITGYVKRTKPSDWLRVPVGRVSSIHPTAIGVDVADQTQTVLPGTTGPEANYLPEYLPRDVDDQLRVHVRAALGGAERRIVVVVGLPKVGKSRTLFEALVWYDREVAPLQFVAPQLERDALENLVASGRVVSKKQSAVLWLNDLEPFLAIGVSVDMLTSWCGQPGRIVAGTLGGTGGYGTPPPIAGLITPADHVLEHARQIPLEDTTPTELRRLGDTVSDVELKAVSEHGLAAYLVAGPKMRVKLETGRHPGAERECWEGVAVLKAAIDWARCGRTSLVSEDILRGLWRLYLRDWVDDTDDEFASALQWARAPVANIAMLQKDRSAGGYRAYEYLVRVQSSQAGVGPPPDEVWAKAIETATLPTEAFAVGDAAFRRGRYPQALKAFSASLRSPDIATDAELNMRLIVFHAVDFRDPHVPVRFDPDALGRFVDDYHDKGQLRPLLVDVLVQQAELLRWGRREDALAAYRRIAALCDHDRDNPDLRRTVAKALNQQGVLLDELGEHGEAFTTHQEVIDRYENDLDSVVSLEVGNALVGQGSALIHLKRFSQARAVYQRVIDNYSGRDILPVQAESGLVFIGGSFLDLAQPEDAIDTYEWLIDRSGDSWLARNHVTTALDDVIKRYGDRVQSDRSLADRTANLRKRIRELDSQ